MVSFTSLPSHAVDYYWNGGTGSWDDPSNWNPYGIPPSISSYPNATNVYIANTPDGSAIAYFTGAPYPNNSVSLGNVQIYGTGEGTMTLSLSGGEFRTSSSGHGIGNNGVVDQTGGEFRFSTDAFVVHTGGTYNLKAGNLTQLDETLGVEGVFNQSGGSVSVDGLFVRGGTYNLSGTGTVGGEVGIIVDQGGVFNQNGGKINAGHRGVHVDSNCTYNYSGGELHVVSDYDAFTNDGTTNLSGAGTRTIDGNVVNNGTFKTTHTTAVYTGTFTNNGAYISDPATQYFNDLVIGQTGYLVGQSNDYFYINGDFINKSTMNTDWNTMHSNLSFITGVDNIHDFYLTGVDYGAAMPGYSNNFSWGVLDITGNVIYLFNGNDIAGGALYLRDIIGLDMSGSLITNIFGMDGLNIYYLANLAENDYLGGLTYDLSGGGYLIGIHGVPEPATMFLLCTGLIGLCGFRRKFRK